MRIGIIGAGKVGGGLGKLWVRAGHEVLFSSRHPNRLKVLVEEAGFAFQWSGGFERFVDAPKIWREQATD